MKRHLQCAEQQVSPSNLTKYCACHEKWLDCFIVLTYETSFPMRGATGVTIQPHQILRLPRKMTRLLYRPHIWNVISNARSNRCHYPTSPNTAPATKNDTARFQRKSPKTGETSFPMRGRSEHDPSMIRAWSEHDPTMKTQTATRLASEVTFRAHHEHFLLKNTTFRAQSYIQTFTKYCACHVKCHLNFTKYCACHEKWHLNFTKYCACHEKWHLNFTKYCAGHCTVTELYCTLLYLTLLYVTLLYVTLLYLTLLYLTLLYLTLLDTTLRDTTLRDTTLLDSTLLDSTLLDSTWHYSTWHYSTWLLFYLTLLYLTCSTWLNFTEMLFVYRKFLNLNFLWLMYLHIHPVSQYLCTNFLIFICTILTFLFVCIDAILTNCVSTVPSNWYKIDDFVDVCVTVLNFHILSSAGLLFHFPFWIIKSLVLHALQAQVEKAVRVYLALHQVAIKLLAAFRKSYELLYQSVLDRVWMSDCWGVKW